MGDLSLGLSEGAICRFQVAAQNLEKELNVLNGLQIRPEVLKQNITMMFW